MYKYSQTMRYTIRIIYALCLLYIQGLLFLGMVTWSYLFSIKRIVTVRRTFCNPRCIKKHLKWGRQIKRLEKGECQVICNSNWSVGCLLSILPFLSTFLIQRQSKFPVVQTDPLYSQNLSCEIIVQFF